MFTTEFLERINRALPMTDYLERSPKSKMYCCPFCESGHGPSATGAFKYYQETNTGACFAGCKEAGEEAHAYDLIAVVGKVEGLNFVDTVKHIANRANMPIEEDFNSRGDHNRAPDPKPAPVEVVDPPTPNTPGKYEDFIKESAARVDAARDYLNERGISNEIIDRYELGFTIYYFAAAGEKLPAVVFPYNREYSYFSCRSIDGKYFAKPPTSEAGEEPLYRPENLYTGEAVYICEGAIDCLSVIQAGAPAVGLIGTAYGKLFPEIKKREPAGPLLLFLDNDLPNPKTGKREGPEAQAKLAKDLKEHGIEYHEACFTYPKYTGPKKDANDLLQANPAQFAEDIAANIRAASDPTGIESFLQEISTDRYKPIPTGVKSIDSLLQGGFMPGTLILCGAPPGTGKTALASMIFETMAEAGRPEIFFNMEMAQAQLIARSISRRIYQNNHRYQLTALDILQSYKLSEESKQLVQEAANDYKNKVGNNLIYNPAGVGTDLDKIIEYITGEGDKAQRDGKPAPNICIDYLHLLTGAPGEETAAILKRAVYAFKAYAVKYNAVVFAIEAQNRDANKSTKATLEAGRDSSGLEYGGDLILQLIRDNQDRPGEVKLYVTKSRFTPANYAGEKFILHGGQAYIEPANDDFKPVANTPYKD